MEALKKEIVALPTPSAASVTSTATHESPQPPPSSLTSMSTPSGPRIALQADVPDLMYPDEDSSPTRSQLDSQPLPGSAPVSSSSTQGNPRQPLNPGSLKRKETPVDGQGGTVHVDRQGKKVKVSSNDIIDVDSYPDVWYKAT